MTTLRAIEMFIKPNFKFFLLPFGFTCIHSAYTFNTLREAKATAEKLWLEKKERYDIMNVYYRNEESDYGGGWRSKRILRMNKNNCSWSSALDNYDLHTSFLFSFDEFTISKWDNNVWKKLQEIDLYELEESDVRKLLEN